MRCTICKIIRRGLVVWLLLVTLGCRGALQTPSLVATPEEGRPKQLLARQLIVTLIPAIPEQWGQMARALAQTYGLRQVGAFPLTSIGVQCVALQIPEDRAMADVLAQLAADPLVESAQSNQLFDSQSRLSNDPYATLQYGVHAVRADRVHPLATGKGVKIAVIDTGVEVEHPDLHGRVRETANFVEGGEKTFQRDWHGTAVAGVIAAKGDNSTGIVGVAPEAEILALKACWQRTLQPTQALCSSWTLAKAVDFAILAGVQVLNFSLAGPPDQLLARLLSAADKRGITTVAATREFPREAGFPASLAAVIAVVASGPNGEVRLPAKAIHPLPLAAPGVEILTTVPHSTYDFVSGSSVAAAHVSGVAALLLERHPELTPAQLHTLLQTTARPLGGLVAPTTTVGFVDACAALQQLELVQVCP